MKVLVNTIYEVDGIGGDYLAVEVFVDGKLAVSYGDYYHDKGDYKADGFIDGLKHLSDGVEVEYKDVEDLEYRFSYPN